MASQCTVAILNRSDTLMHFQWKSFATEVEEEQHRLRFFSKRQQEKDDEMEQFLLLTLFSETTSNHQDSLAFHLTLDIGNIFVCYKHCYEVLVSNKGLINAPHRLIPPTTAVGLCFSFSPPEGMVPPGACHVLEVRFFSDKLGTFSEEFYFTVLGNPQPLILTFRGCVICLTFHVNITELDFGQGVRGGVKEMVQPTGNRSTQSAEGGGGKVKMQVSPKCRGREGFRPRSVAQAQQADGVYSYGKSVGEKEGGKDSTLVTLCSNTVQQYSLAMVVDVNGVGEELLALPVKANCIVPEVHLESSVLQFQRCFLGYPYKKTIRLSNDTNLPACYGLLDQNVFDQCLTVLYCSSKRSDSAIQSCSCIGQGPVDSISSTELHFGTIPVLTDIPRTLQLFNKFPISAQFLSQMAKSNTLWRVEPAEGEIPPEGEGKSRCPLAASTFGAPVFSLTPTHLELGPGHSADMLLEGFCDTPKVRQKLCLTTI
ncbi:hydrocephalus-inducing protein homolog isoform X1 [Tachysurus ichikawai]